MRFTLLVSSRVSAYWLVGALRSNLRAGRRFSLWAVPVRAVFADGALVRAGGQVERRLSENTLASLCAA
jgi:hypothetical protein